MGAASLARFMMRIDGRMGVGYGGTGLSACRIELVIGRRDGAVAAPITALMASPPAHTLALLVRAADGSLVRPATVLTTHGPVDSPILTSYISGPAFAGVADAVDHAALVEPRFPPNRLNDLLMLAVLRLNPDLALDPITGPYEPAVRDAARVAMNEAIGGVLAGLNLVGVVPGYKPRE